MGKLYHDNYELPRNNRFLVKFPEEFNIPDWIVRTSTLPLEKRNGEITVTLRTPILLDTNKKNPYYCIEDFDMAIELLNQSGNVMDRYKLEGCKILGANNSKLDYENDDIISSVIEISYENCTIEGNVIGFISK